MTRSAHFRRSVAVSTWLLLTPAAYASVFTETSPTTGGAAPFQLAPVGGIVVDAIGANGNRVISQLTASSLPSGFFNTSPATLGTQTGYNNAITGQLGGGFSEFAVRITAFDFDNAVGEFDANRNTLTLNGISLGNFTTIIAQSTGNDGTATGNGFSVGGFRNNLTDTGWFYITDPTLLANLFASIDAADQLVFAFTDTTVNDNSVDFSRGVDALGSGLTLGPVLVVLADPLEEVARTPTQREVGRVLDAQDGAGNDLETVLDLIQALPTAAQQRAALDAVAGRMIFMAGDSAIGAAEVQGFNIDSRLDAIRRGEPSRGVRLALAGDETGMIDPAAVTDQPDTATDAAPAIPLTASPGPLPTDDRFGLFVLGSVTLADTSGSNAQVGSEVLSAGVTLGIDTPLNDRTILGVALGFGDNNTEFDDDSRFDSQSYTLSLYSTHQLFDSLFLDLAAAYTFADISTTRQIVMPGLTRTAEGDTDGHALSAKARLVYEHRVGDWTLAPEAQVRYAEAWIDNYTETGAGGLSLNVDDQHATSLTTTLGLTLRRSWALPRGQVITPYIGAAWEAELLDDSRSITTTFVGDPSTPFGTFTDEPDDSYARAWVGITARLSDRLSVYADYQTLLAHRDTEAHTFFAGLRVAF